MKRLLLPALCSLLTAFPAFALVDANNNGMSDLWEMRYNQGVLLPETFDPQGNDDGDGWSNAQEAAAGTDPFDANSPAGFIRPAIANTPAVWGDPDEDGNPDLIAPEAVTVNWTTSVGKRYTLSYSPDLTNWIAVGNAFTGNGNQVSYSFQSEAASAGFWRVAITDIDGDGDGLSNYEEALAGANSYRLDSDFDGVSDYDEVVYLATSPASAADLDGDGIPDDFEKDFARKLLAYQSDPAYWQPDEFAALSVGNLDAAHAYTADGTSVLETHQLLAAAARYAPKDNVLMIETKSRGVSIGGYYQAPWAGNPSGTNTLSRTRSSSQGPSYPVSQSITLAEANAGAFEAYIGAADWHAITNPSSIPADRVNLDSVASSYRESDHLPSTFSCSGLISQRSYRFSVTDPSHSGVSKSFLSITSTRGIDDNSGAIGDIVFVTPVTVSIPAGHLVSQPMTQSAPLTAETRTLNHLVSFEVVSRDRFLAGSFSIPLEWNSFGMEFIGPDGTLGKYENLPSGGTTKIYDKVEDILETEDYAAGSQADTQKVWFVRDETDFNKINFYTCFDSIGDVYIRLYVNGNANPFGEIAHTLTAAQDFADVIDYVDDWVKGASFDFSGGGGTSPLAMSQMSMNAAGEAGIHNLTRAALIPFFNVINHVEGLGSVAFGLLDGVKSGICDDWQLLMLIKGGLVSAGGWAWEAAEEELTKWKDDPLKRAAELKKAADRLCQDWVFKPMAELKNDLSTWEGFKRRSWNAWNSVKGTTNKAWVLTKNSWGYIQSGLSEWVDDFAGRMMEGAEKAHWSESVFAMGKIQADANETARQACYTFGYTFGYISEQVAVGILTGGTVKIAGVMTKSGVAMAGRLAARRVLPVVARLQFVKKWAASLVISVELKVGVERGLIIAAETPVSLAVKDSVVEVIERGLARATYQRATFSTSQLLDEILKAPYVKQLFLTPGLEGQCWWRLGEWFHLLGDDATAEAAKGWVKVYNRLLKFEGNTLVEDRASDLYQLIKTHTAEGKTALRKTLEEFGATDGTGKLWLKDVEKIQAEGYRYSNFDPRFDAAGNPVAGPPRLRAVDAPEGGWYASFDKFDAAEAAKPALQIPPANSAKYRLEFDWEAVKNNIRVPRGENHNAEWLEMLAKDFSINGAGGGTQVVIDGIDIPIKAIWYVSGISPVKIY